jgi:hypothetical protein
MQDVELVLSDVRQLVSINEYERAPSYFIHAGLTFIPLVQPYLREWGDDWCVQRRAMPCPRGFH